MTSEAVDQMTGTMIDCEPPRRQTVSGQEPPQLAAAIAEGFAADTTVHDIHGATDSIE